MSLTPDVFDILEQQCNTTFKPPYNTFQQPCNTFEQPCNTFEQPCNIGMLLQQVLSLVEVIDDRLGSIAAECRGLREQVQEATRNVAAVDGNLARLGDEQGEMRRQVEQLLAGNCPVKSDDRKLGPAPARLLVSVPLVLNEAEKQKIKQVVPAFVRDRDWARLKKGLEPLLPRNTDEYKQLQLMRSLHQVCCKGHTKLASLLLDASLPVTTATYSGDTLLHGAASGGHLQLVNTLLERGADVSTRGSDDWTPLMWAAYGGNLEVARRLVEAGALVTARDKGGRTALDLARVACRPPVARYLEELKS